MTLEGKVKWFDKLKGYGFIVGEDDQEYFVHYTQIPRGINLVESDSVQFTPTTTDRGRQATDVGLLN